MSDETSKKQPKFKLTTKLWFYAGGLAALLGFIGISAWWDLTFGAFNLKNFIADTLILIAIAIATMVLSDLLSEETNMNKIVGLYNIARNDYDAIYAQVAGILVYFSQWYFWFLERETRRKREGYLILNGFDGLAARRIVAFAELSDIPLMESCQKVYIKVSPSGRKIPLPKIETPEQKEVIQSVLKGEQDVKNTNYVVYLFTDDISEANMSALERQDYLEKRRKQSKRKAYIMRIVMLVLTALLMAALAPADDEEGADKNKWWLFIKRLGVFITSFLSGWLAGATDVAAKAAQIKDKKSILTSFKDCYDKKLWEPKSQEQLDQEAIEEWEKTNALQEEEAFDETDERRTD